MLRTPRIALAFALCAPAVQAQQLPPVTSLVESPVVRIGGVAEGPPEQLFTGIVGAVRLPNGHVAIADGGNHVIRVFTSEGTHVRSIGREGSGPAEFRGLWWLGWCPDEGLVAVDAILGRALVFAPDAARLLRTVTLPSWLLFNDYLTCHENSDVAALLRQPTVLGEKGRVTQFPATVARFRLGAETREDIFELPGAEFYFALNAGGYSPLPLGMQPHAAAAVGTVYAGQNKEPVVRWFDLDTGERGTIAHGLPLSAVSRESWEKARTDLIEELPLTRTRQLARDVLSEVSAPETGPMFTGMAADQSGRLWLRLPASADVATWHVYERSGTHAGRVALPARIRPLVIDDCELIGVDRDSLGIQSLVIYRNSTDIVR